MMRKHARIALLIVLGAGLWLALKPTLGNRRFTFLPVRLSEFVDSMDFWLNFTAFAILAGTAWLAFGSGDKEKATFRAGAIIGVITLLNVLLELMQTSIPGRAMDLADVWAGLLGCVLGAFLGMVIQWRMSVGKPRGNVPQVLFLDQTGRLGGAELMLLDIAAARAADSEAILFQDGEFRTALEAARVKTHVFKLGDEAAAVDKKAGLVRTLRSIPDLIRLMLRIAHAARSFDVVYANTAKSLIIGGPAAWIAGRPLVFHLHDIVSDVHFSALNRHALIFCANAFAKAVIANSEATKVSFVASGGRVERCVMVPNGFRIPETRSTAAEIDLLRSNLNLPTDAWVVLMAGRLSHWKGQHVLLEALKSVPNAHAVLLGDALFTAEDREYAAQLHAQANEAELAGRIHFAGFQTETLAYFDMADVVVHASVFPEPFGRVIVEGMLAGKAVIASRAGGAAEIVQHEQTGLLVEPGRVNELADALLRLKKHPDFAATLANNAAQAARDTYDLATVQAKIEAVIRQTARRETEITTPTAQIAGQPS